MDVRTKNLGFWMKLLLDLVIEDNSGVLLAEDWMLVLLKEEWISVVIRKGLDFCSLLERIGFQC